MKDYSNYRPLPKDTLYWSGIKIFERELEDYGDNVLVDGVEIKAIIKTHTNPYNELKEDRKFLCSLDTKIKRGSLVDYDNKKWLVLNEVKNNQIYQYSKIIQCTHTIKLYKNFILHEIPCAVEGGIRLHQLGTSNSKYIETPSTIITVRLPYNDITSQIKRGDIYKIGKQNYIVQDWNELIESGLLVLKMEYTAEEQKLPLKPEPIQILGNESIIKNMVATYSVDTSEVGEVVFSIEGDLGELISQDGISGVCKIKAGNKYGTIILHVQNLDGSFKNSKIIQIKGII